jgi:hypothetical protein
MRHIALSNLSILKTSFFRGPEAAWEIAQAAGFSALKVNPLRGATRTREWTGKRLRDAGVLVTAFEAPWRESFEETLIWAVKTGEKRALLIDPVLFGYQSALYRLDTYPEAYPEARIVTVDWPRSCFVPQEWIRAIETDAQKLSLVELHAKNHLVFDTWHLRGFHPGSPTYPNFDPEKVVAIDVQTRDVDEWLAFIDDVPCLLSRQLSILSRTPDTVSAALEIHPVHLGALAKRAGLSVPETLRELRVRIEESLGTPY